jgi:hypothetical protein
MVVRTDPRLAVLHALKLTGRARPDGLSERSAIGVEQVEALLTDLAGTGLVEYHEGNLPGWSLTSLGRQAHADALAGERAVGENSQYAERAYAAFLDRNEAFKVLCTAWQLRPAGRAQVLNDHRDRSYDASLVGQLAEIHQTAMAVTTDLAQVIERFSAYGPRFTKALARLRAGDLDAFTRPLSGSYHDVWMELHQDFLDTLGRSRSAADGQ